MSPEEITGMMLSFGQQAGASDVVAMVIEEEDAMVRFSNNQITTTNRAKEKSGYIFVMDGPRKAGTSISDLSKRSLGTTIKKVVEVAKRSPPGEEYAPLPSGPFSYRPDLLVGPDVSLDPRRHVRWVREAVEAAMAQGAKRVAGSLQVHRTKFTLRTSAGAFGVTKRSGLEMSVRAFCTENASGHGTNIACQDQDFDPASAGAEAGKFARMALEAKEVPPGSYDAILGPMVFADLVQQVGRMASAFHIDAGFSFLAGRLGERIASPALNLWDDATQPNTYGAQAFDHEGVPTRSTQIIRDGVLSSYLHNTATAKKYQVSSTGNAGLIAPHPLNLIVGEGQSTMDELLRSVDRGLYVTNNWYLRYQNYLTGEFSTIPRDAILLIENGAIVGAVKDVRISDSMLNLLSRIESMSRQRRWVKWWEVEVPTLSPTVLVRGLNFTRSMM